MNAFIAPKTLVFEKCLHCVVLQSSRTFASFETTLSAYDDVYDADEEEKLHLLAAFFYYYYVRLVWWLSEHQA